MVKDKTYDILVKLEDISTSSAEITIKSISEKIPSFKQESEEPQYSPDESEKESKSNLGWWIAGAVLFLAIIFAIGFTLLKKKNKI